MAMVDGVMKQGGKHELLVRIRACFFVRACGLYCCCKHFKLAVAVKLRRRTMDKPIAWYDPTNGAVSTDKNSPLFTPLGQVLPLYTKQEQEPFEYWNAVEGWVKIDEVREHFDSVGCGTIYKTAGEGREPLYTTPPQRTWVGLTDQEIEDAIYDGFAFGLDNGNVSNQTVIRYVIRVIEAKLKEKNS